MKFILGSASPRRQQMLRDLGLPHSVITADIIETHLKKEAPVKFAQRMAREKAETVMKRRPERTCAVLTADTIVVKDQKILGKPQNRADALKMLKLLSGKTHEVITAWCWLVKDGKRVRFFVAHATTEVSFAKRSDGFWRWYVSTGEPMDKAGAYAAQGIGMSFIRSVRGSYSNVVGLPLSDVLESFRKTLKKSLHEFTNN